jgi:hypothetical protein
MAPPADSALDRMFVALLKFTRVTPVPETQSEVISESTVIVRGSFADVADGRVIDFREGASNPVLTAVFELHASTVLKGPELDTVYAEYPRAIVAPIEQFKAHIRDTDCIFILREPGWDESVYRFDYPGRGLPEGDVLHAFNFPFGIMCEGQDGAIEYPLLSEPPRESFASSSVEQLEDELADMIMR